MGSDSYYDILGLSPAATAGDIRARYRQLILRIHPDRDGPVALFRQVQEAYEVLSDPVLRATYDRDLGSPGRMARADRGAGPHWQSSGASARPRDHARGAGPAAADPHRSAASGRGVNPGGAPFLTSVLGRSPALTVAIAGALLLALGAVVTEVGTELILLGSVTLLVAGVTALGARGAQERQAYQRSGMTAVDAMTGRQFEALLEHFFAHKGYRVARIGGRGESGALLLNDADGRMIVQARRRNDLVRHDAVQRAIVAMARYRAGRALVVTSSDYSQQAVTVANSHGVTLWNRADLAAELTAFRGSLLTSGVQRFASDFRDGSRICFGFLATLFVAAIAVWTQDRKVSPKERR